MKKKPLSLTTATPPLGRPLPATADNGDRRKVRSVAVFWAAVLGLLLLYGWVAYCGLVWFDVDSNWGKHAALVKLTTGRFAAPMAEGRIPHASLVYHWYPLYPVVLAGYLHIVGTSHAAHVWFDLGLNGLAGGLAAWWLAQRSRSGWLAALYLLGVQYLAAYKLGRPETLASLCTVLAVLFSLWGGKRWTWLVGFFLGCAVAASYPVGLACCVAWAVGFLVAAKEPWKRSLDLAGVSLVAIATTLVIWLHVVLPYPREAVEALVYNKRLLGDTVGDLARGLLATGRLSIPLLLALGMVGSTLARSNLITSRLAEDDIRLARSVWWGAVAYLMVLLVLLRRPAAYYLPTLGHLLLPVATYFAWQMLSPRWVRWRFFFKALVGLGVVFVGAWLNVFIIRAAVLPLGWRENAMTPARALQLILEMVPPTSSVGGDGKLLSVVGTNRLFIPLPWTGSNNWPEYIVSPLHPRTLEPTLYGHRNFGSRARVRIEREYQPLPTQPAYPAPCALSEWLHGWGVASPRYRGCDWFIRFWKRRASFVEDGETNSPE